MRTKQRALALPWPMLPTRSTTELLRESGALSYPETPAPGVMSVTPLRFSHPL